VTFPDWWGALLLGLASWRIWHLLAEDTILHWPRRYVTRLPQDWDDEHDRPQDLPPEYRDKLADFITCPFCMGFWVALGWFAAYLIFPTETLWVAVPFALNAAVVAVNHWLSSD